MNVFIKITDVISADLRHSKFMDVENSVVDRFDVFVHNLAFFVCLGFFFIFYTDLLFFESAGSLSVANMLHFHQKDIMFIDAEPLKTVHFFSTLLVIFIGFTASIYFYFKYGHEVSRYEFGIGKIQNLFFRNMHDFLGALLAIFIMFYGGYIFTIRIPHQLSLDLVPGFIFVQIALILKIQSLMAFATVRACQILYPYSLHPKRVLKA